MSTASILTLARSPSSSPAAYISPDVFTLTDKTKEVLGRTRETIELRLVYLLGKEGRWSNVAVPLADDGGVLAAADGIHHPVGVVIVHNVDEAPSASADKKSINPVGSVTVKIV
ncbi:hypothetical protein BHE74_00038335 [Ensete ventricosum]|nr:hypothetical protein GW17_00018819 [Ensete ventricosum]RWW55042.1 hypothetical protein BHE74_00038335 [Ensete ventricosum]RZS22623.1 hypothetical protein BHM03_00055429 [Ensete ventricosum]